MSTNATSNLIAANDHYQMRPQEKMSQNALLVAVGEPWVRIALFQNSEWRYYTASADIIGFLLEAILSRYFIGIKVRPLLALVKTFQVL